MPKLSTETSRPFLSVVAPVFNEAESIAEFIRQLRGVLDGLGKSYEVVFVDDGSRDGSAEIIEREAWAEARVIRFVVNAGHMAALDAGYRESRGQFVVTLDSDLQHPPELIPELIEVAVAEQVDVVYAARETREGDTWFKRTSARAYYRAMRSLTDLDLHDSAADFRLISHRVAAVLRSLPPTGQVFRLLIPSLGFPSATVRYEAAPRFAGRSKYTLRGMVNLSVASVVGFTTKPLTLSIRVGIAFAVAAVLGFGYVIVTYVTGRALEGWASMISTMLLMFGILFVILGVFGLYLGAILRAVRSHPTYVVDRSPDDPSEGPR